MSKHINNYLTHKKILYVQQCGFTNELSTDISLAKLLKHVHDRLDANNFGISVFLDLRKAFDMVNRDNLLSKLLTYSIKGYSAVILKIGKQYVTIKSTMFSTSPIRMGIPLGYNLEPLLFFYIH